MRVHHDVSRALGDHGVRASFESESPIDADASRYNYIMYASLFRFKGGNGYKNDNKYINGLLELARSTAKKKIQLRIYHDDSAKTFARWNDLKRERHEHVCYIRYEFKDFMSKGRHEGLLGTCVRNMAAYDFASCGEQPRIVVDIDDPAFIRKAIPLLPKLRAWDYDLFFQYMTCYYLRDRNRDPFLERHGLKPRIMNNFVWFGPGRRIAGAGLGAFFSCVLRQCKEYAAWRGRVKQADNRADITAGHFLFRFGIDEFMMNAFVLRQYLVERRRVAVYLYAPSNEEVLKLKVDCTKSADENKCIWVSAQRVRDHNLAEILRFLESDKKLFEKNLRCFQDLVQNRTDHFSVFEYSYGGPGPAEFSLEKTRKRFRLELYN